MSCPYGGFWGVPHLKTHEQQKSHGTIIICFSNKIPLIMAISGQDKCSWQTKHLPFEIVMFLLEQITSFVHSATNTREDNSHKQQQQQRQWLKVRINANLLGYEYIHDWSSFEPDVVIECIAQAFSDRFVDVHIVYDHPTNCHPSKQATCEYQANAEKWEIKLIVARSQSTCQR